MQKPNTLSAETLGQIALIQGMVAHLPDRESILKFVCRGLEIVPGTGKVSYRIIDKKISEKGLQERHQEPASCFQLRFKNFVYGEVVFRIMDPELFSPYVP